MSIRININAIVMAIGNNSLAGFGAVNRLYSVVESFLSWSLSSEAAEEAAPEIYMPLPAWAIALAYSTFSLVIT